MFPLFLCINLILEMMKIKCVACSKNILRNKYGFHLLESTPKEFRANYYGNRHEVVWQIGDHSECKLELRLISFVYPKTTTVDISWFMVSWILPELFVPSNFHDILYARVPDVQMLFYKTLQFYHNILSCKPLLSAYTVWIEKNMGYLKPHYTGANLK